MEISMTIPKSYELELDRAIDASDLRWASSIINQPVSSRRKMFATIELDPARSIRLQHEFAGETFELQREEGIIRLCHDRWSLEGEGANLLEAEQDLVNNARIIADAYLKSPVDRMTQGALALREFLFKVI